MATRRPFRYLCSFASIVFDSWTNPPPDEVDTCVVESICIFLWGMKMNRRLPKVLT